VAQSINSLSTVLSARGDFAGALAQQQRALAIWEASLGAEPPVVAMGLGNVATSQMRAGDFEAAEGTARRALAMRERMLPDDHVDVGFSRIVLSEILLHRQKLDEAAELAQGGLDLMATAVGDEHSYIAFACLVLAHIDQARGDVAAARGHFERGVAILKATPDDPLLGQARAGLGGVLLELGEPAAAAAELELSLDALAPDPSSLPRAQDQLARALWHDPAQHDRARELARVAINGYGADTHPDAAARRADLRRWLEEHTPATNDR
jgi:tetratricopeptide (TPR) repeat protein